MRRDAVWHACHAMPPVLPARRKQGPDGCVLGHLNSDWDVLGLGHPNTSTAKQREDRAFGCVTALAGALHASLRIWHWGSAIGCDGCVAGRLTVKLYELGLQGQLGMPSSRSHLSASPGSSGSSRGLVSLVLRSTGVDCIM
eukprot:194110-Chlamydomonas_euryale.AAC.5